MASHDYYNKPLPRPQASSSPSPTPYYDRYNQDSSSTYSVPPPYSSRQHLGADWPPQGVPNTSPFESVFDDHVYPINSQSPAASQQHLNAQDTSYYGLSRTPSDEMRNNQSGDIPLQDRQTKDAEQPDHVYEAPRRRGSRKKGVRFGELGMFGANTKRIPWVVYVFTVVQIGVFIGEIVKNGE